MLYSYVRMIHNAREHKRSHFLFLAVFMMILCALSAALTVWAVYATERVHAQQTYDEILRIKKAFLKDTVRNTIRNIDRLRAFNRALAKAGAARGENPEAWANERTKAGIAAVIREHAFADGGYIWVNEIIDWKGGPGYAIRRIHPNLPDSEGSLLSTETRDIKGNLPYLTELEGVRDRGEVFFTYFFKRRDSDRVAEKISYATAYRDYDWIISMGVYLEDLQTYVDDVHEESVRLTKPIVLSMILVFLGLFASALVVLSRKERRFLAKTSRIIREESNVDHLTGAQNRRIGDAYLQSFFEKFNEGAESPLLFMLDIDDFKVVNDTWGHAVGDQVLTKLAHALKSVLRAGDLIIRWGGEEFLLICADATRDSAAAFAEKILDAARMIELRATGDSFFGITVSVGVSWFGHRDRRYEAAVARADEALYRAKDAGKDCARTAPPEA